MSKENNQVLTFFAISLIIVTGGSLLWLLGTLFGKTINLLAQRDHQYLHIDVNLNNTNDSASQLLKLNVVADNDNFSGYSIIRQRELRKILAEKYGYEINYQRHDRDKEINLLNNGEVDIWATTLDRYLEEKPNGKIVGSIGRSVGADAIIIHKRKYANLKSKHGINSLLQLGGRQTQLGMAYVNDSSSEYFAFALKDRLESFNLKNCRTLKTKKETETWQLLKNSRSNVAIGVVSEPYVTLAEKYGYEILLSSKDVDKSLVYVIVASDRTLLVNPEKIIQFLEAYYALIDKNVIDPVKIKEYIAKESKISLEEAEKILSRIDFFTATEAKNWMEDGSLQKRLDSISSILLSTEKIQEIPNNYRGLFTSKYLERASNNTAKLISALERKNPKLAQRLAGIGETIAGKNHQNKTENLDEKNIHE